MSTDTELNYLGPVGTERFIANVKALLDTKQSKEKYGKLVVFGDSIGQGAANNNYSYVDILEESGAFESVAKYCVSGATIGPYATLSSASGYSLVEQIERYSNDVTNADIVICEYEGNDVMALMSGTVSIGSVDDDVTATTVCGYTKKAIGRILELNPSARVVWVPVVRNNFPWLKTAYPDSMDTVDTYLLYDATVLKIVSGYGCSVISAYTGYAIADYLVDGLHPNTEGHKLIAEKIIHNIFAESEYVVPERMITATGTSSDASFSKILALVKAGASITFTYMYNNIYPNVFHLNYYDANRMTFSTVSTYDRINFKNIVIEWYPDGSHSTKEYDLENNDATVIDNTLSISGAAADSASVGTAINNLEQQVIDAFWDGNLYYAGNECEIVTGGWWTIGYVFTQGLTAAAPTITKQDSYMDVSLSGNYVSGLLSTSDDSLIDVTDFDKIQVEVSNVTIDNATGGMWLLLSDENDNYSGTTKITADGIIEKDISGLSGKYHVVISFAVVSGTNSLRIHKAKLIKNCVPDEISVTADSIADALGYIPADVDDIPTKTSDLTNDSGFITGYTETDPTVPAWAKAAKKPTYTAAEVGAEPSGTAASVVSGHNTSTDSHNDIRLLVQELTTKVNNFLDSDDTTLDELSELVTAIKANAGTISQLTSGKVNAADIINNLTTNVANKPLSAAQGVVLKGLIDGLNNSLANYQPKGDYALEIDIPTKTSDLTNDSGFITGYTETDPTVPAWAKAAKKPTYTAAEVGALPSTTTIPSKTSQLTNDTGFITGYTETDPTVPSWAKQANKPTYTKSEVGLGNVENVKQYSASNPPPYPVTSVNGKTGAVTLNIEEIPDYVTTEAESVIDRVVAAQGENTFTFAAITDLHYGNGGNTDGVQHACQALKYIDSRIKLDAVAVLGDYTDGYPASGLANAVGDFRTINSVLNGLRFAPNLRIQGNHDYYADHGPVVRRYIQAYSDDVVWGNRAAGYFYRDFEDFKIRAICLNTTEIDNANISCSTEQYNWFINSLDMSTKDDAADWSILILSHHPLDWYVQDGTYRFGNILWAYNNGTNWSGGGVTCDFTGKNSATIVANIHGHIHNLLTGEVYRNTGATSIGTSGVVRMCTPEACIKRANQYDGLWKETTSYDKVEGTAQETSFVIYCVDLDTNLITAVCYGAGYDRTIDYINGTKVITYTITNNLTNVTSNNDAVTEIEAGNPYTATLTPTGASITSVTVTMGGVDVTSTVYSNGVINIDAVSGDIVITAVGAAPVTYTNMIPLAVTNTGAAYVGTNGEDGYKRGYRLNSGAVETAAEAFGVTGFIPVKFGDFVYFKNISFAPGIEDGSGNYIFVYDSTFACISGTKSTNMEFSAYLFRPIETYDNGYLKSVKMADGSKDYAYIRISAKLLDANSIITVNQEIV